MDYFLGIDISTTGSKALIVDPAGRVAAASSHPHTLSTPKPLWSEQDPRQWWQAASASIRAALTQAGISGAAITAVGLTGQMHGLVLLDGQGEVLRPAILWNDQRTQAQCDEIHRRLGRERFIQISGNAALTGFTAPKILWVAQNEPEVYERTAHILLPKDYIRWRLTGQFGMDKADGSGTVLFDLRRRTWSEDILTALDIPPAWMPPTWEGPQFTGVVTPDAAQETGLAAGTPVAAGGGDQACQALGAGVVESGIAGLTVGTSGVVFAATSAPLIEPQGRLHAFCHAAPGLWALMGVMLSAAGSLQWFRDSLAAGISFDNLLQEAEAAPPGSEGLLFLPYLSGERTPHPDPQARGAFAGLTLRHTRAHLTRAVLEGVAFGLKDAFELLKTSGLAAVTQVRASGGGTRSALWLKIMASALECPLITIDIPEGAAFGAALLAAAGAGAYPDALEACRAMVRITGQADPDPEMMETARRSYPLYRDLYPALSPTFHKII